MSARDWITLARPSNLPTVWSNVLAGACLASGGLPSASRLALLVASGSIFYSGGMILNDAFDREIDSRERPERPIPAGRVRAKTAFLIGFLMITCAGALAMAAATNETRTVALFSSLLLATAIVIYDANHKRNPVAPFVMGACRALLYVLAAATISGAAGAIAVAPPALAIYAWVVGLTYVARAEAKGDVPLVVFVLLSVPVLFALLGDEAGLFHRALVCVLILWTGRSILLARRRKIGPAIVALIAGISLVDAVLLSRAGLSTLALVAAAGVPLTTLLQRWVRGT